MTITNAGQGHNNERVRADHAQRLLDLIDRRKWAGAVVVIVLLLFVYCVLPSVLEGRQQTIEFLRALITNLIPIPLVFCLSWWLFRSIDEVRKEREQRAMVNAVTAGVRDELLPVIERRPFVYRRFDDVPWSDLIRESDNLDIIVQYFNSWAKTHQDALEEFFSRGGTIRILLPDPEDSVSLEQIKARFLESEQSSIKGKIENTPVRFSTIRKSIKSGKGRLEIRFVKAPIWYCALRFSSGVAALSPFESKREVGVNSPCFVMRGPDAKDFIRWFDKEFDHLWKMARPWVG